MNRKIKIAFLLLMSLILALLVSAVLILFFLISQAEFILVLAIALIAFFFLLLEVSRIIQLHREGEPKGKTKEAK